MIPANSEAAEDSGPSIGERRTARSESPSFGVGWRRVLTAAGLTLLVAAAVHSALAPPPVIPASAAATEFSAERAMVHLREIAQRPRPTGSPEHARVRDYILAELRGLGLSPEVQAATGVSTFYPAAARIQNIVVRVPGAGAARPAVLLMAHYDGVAAGPAAGDDGSGVVELLETLRAIRAGEPLRNDVIALFTDAEEDGLVGAAAFAREHPAAQDLGVVLNFEARGTRGRSLMFETGPDNLEIVRGLATAAPGATGSSLMYDLYRRQPNDTDFSELKHAGIQGLNFAFVGDEAGYHTPLDNIDRIDLRSVQHHGNSALSLTRHFGSTEAAPLSERDAAFFNVAGSG